ncbi:hypothetical protein ASH01_17440 [Terrabacter sp. Soil811]|uniref:hypothetical protein n=1 Tax=Terrabacter sp. Soil811 TaxID=1736419 RepID=UPI0006F400A0|nr:hypothetical protein ASH01_17440 [Terrabacter sp. Soil811]
MQITLDDLTDPAVIALLDGHVAQLRSISPPESSHGSADFFAPARALYAAHGFAECGPFGRYRLDPHSTFMTLEL